MTDTLAPQARRLLALSRDADEPTRENARLVWRSLTAAVAATATTTALSAHAAGSAGSVAVSKAVATSGSNILVLLKWVGLGACLGSTAILGATQFAPTEPTPETLRPPRIVAVASAVAPRSAAAASAPLPAVAIEASSRPLPLATRPAVSLRGAASDAKRESIERETRLLAQARRALAQGDAAWALAILDDYNTEFPAGVLREEADASRVLAFCSSGQKAAGAKLLLRFNDRYPNSPLLQRLREACHVE